MMDAFHKKAAVAALKNMFAGGYFNICVVDKLINLTGCVPDGDDYRALSALHCVDWKDMDAELREMVFLKTVTVE